MNCVIVMIGGLTLKLTECIHYLLTNAQHTVFQHLKNNLARFDVTPVQYGVLKCLWDEDGQPPKQIAKVLGLDSSTITGILDRMENKGLIGRIPDSDDRRTIKIIITSDGLKLQEQLERVIEDANEHFLQIFSDEEQEQFKRFLELIANNQIVG